MLRIVAGSAGGRRIAAPAGRGTRPTADRVREALFGTLGTLRGGLGGARFLDLYAGSGAVGLEAVSRGAAAALLVESVPAVIRVLTANRDALGLARAGVRAEAVHRLPVPPPPEAGGPFDVVFADPPYSTTRSELVGVLARLADGGWLTADALVVVERSSRDAAWAWPPGFRAVRQRRYGEATLWYGRAAPADAPPSEGEGPCDGRCAPAPSTR